MTDTYRVFYGDMRGLNMEMMMARFEVPNCKGSWDTGCCGKCARCLEGMPSYVAKLRNDIQKAKPSIEKAPPVATLWERIKERIKLRIEIESYVDMNIAVTLHFAAGHPRAIVPQAMPQKYLQESLIQILNREIEELTVEIEGMGFHVRAAIADLEIPF